MKNKGNGILIFVVCKSKLNLPSFHRRHTTNVLAYFRLSIQALFDKSAAEYISSTGRS